MDEIEQALHLALAHIDAERLWVNPDCGLKTRSYPEAEPALRNMVEATQRVRASLAETSGQAIEVTARGVDERFGAANSERAQDLPCPWSFMPNRSTR